MNIMTLSSWQFVLIAGIGTTLFCVLLFLSLPAYTQRYQQRFQARVNEKLYSAFVFLDPERIFTLQVVVSVGAVLVTWTITSSVWLAALMAVLIGFLPTWILHRLKLKRAAQFRDQLPDAVMIMSSSMRSGNSLLVSLDAVATEMPKPICQEFELMLRECRLGIRLEDALGSLERRNAIEEMRLLGAAIRISLETGGNLAESLETLAASLRSKLAIEGKLDALTSQGKLQAWVVGCLPFAIAAVLYQIDRVGMTPMFTTPKGWIACGLVIVLQALGVLVIRRIVRIEV